MIDKFNFENLLKPHTYTYKNIGIIGSENTNLIKTILNHLSPLVHHVYIFSSHIETDYIEPGVNMYKEFSERVLENIMNDQIKIKRKIDENIIEDYKKKRVVIVLDDISKENDILNWIIMCGCHFYITLIVAVNSPLSVPIKLRDNMCCITTGLNTVKRLKLFHKHYLHDIEYSKFLKIYESIMKEKYSFMIIIDNFWVNDSNLNQHLFYGKNNY